MCVIIFFRGLFLFCCSHIVPLRGNRISGILLWHGRRNGASLIEKGVKKIEVSANLEYSIHFKVPLAVSITVFFFSFLCWNRMSVMLYYRKGEVALRSLSKEEKFKYVRMPSISSTFTCIFILFFPFDAFLILFLCA